MHRKGLSGIGVTEREGGPLIGNLSMSDLRGLTPDRQAVESGRGRGVLPAWLAALHEQFEWLCQHCAAASNGTTTRSPAPDARCTGNNPAFSLSLPCRFGALALPVGSFLLLQKGKGLRWEDCLTEQLPPAIKVGARPAIKAHDWVVWWPRHRRPCPAPLCRPVQEGRWAEALSAIPLVTVKPSATFRETIMNLIDHNKHRWGCCSVLVHAGRASPRLLSMPDTAPLLPNSPSAAP